MAETTEHDWLEAVSASRFLPQALSSPSSPAASPAAVLCQEAGSAQACQSLVKALSRVSSSPSNDTKCCLLTGEELKKKKKNTHVFWLPFLDTLFEPLSSPPWHLSSLCWTAQQHGNHGDEIWPPHASAQHSSNQRALLFVSSSLEVRGATLADFTLQTSRENFKMTRIAKMQITSSKKERA